ncbi:MAG: prepilin-type N-terminal cleavage/methylation domain-containing protein [Pseudomonadota bacterium]
MIVFSKSAAFTLIELSIVLIIIGLVIGGTLVGKDLIKASELRSVISDIDKYKTAVNVFRLKYNAIPGDMSDATSIWGASAVCNWGKNTDEKTCNGNGDGIIGAPTNSDFSNASYTYEYYSFWQHLSNANLVNGKFTGGGALGTGDYGVAETGINVPKIFANGCMNILRWQDTPGFATYYQLPYKTLLYIGSPIAGDVCYAPLFTPTDALFIDTKIDNGLPGSGSIVTLTPNWAETANCATSLDPDLATYKISNTSIACSLLVRKFAN